MLGCLMYQTRPPDETLVFASDVPVADLLRMKEDFPHARFRATLNMDDWGHEKRANGLEQATGDVIGWFADDDDYDNTYAARLMAEIEQGADVAYCDWSYTPVGCSFSSGSSTSGNFLIRTDLARKVGWNGRHYEADGQFIDCVRSRTTRIIHLNEVLYTHNAHERTI